jgi:hypothetical protein
MLLLIIRHDWFSYTPTKCAIPDDMAGQQCFYTLQFNQVCLPIRDVLGIQFSMHVENGTQQRGMSACAFVCTKKGWRVTLNGISMRLSMHMQTSVLYT